MLLMEIGRVSLAPLRYANESTETDNIICFMKNVALSPSKASEWITHFYIGKFIILAWTVTFLQPFKCGSTSIF